MDGDPLDDEVTQARLVLIFKKGDVLNLDNYRPLSLLNVIYKVYAICLRERLQQDLEHRITKTPVSYTHLTLPTICSV
eukprot:11097212-Prorocentrum_lima.AAC.1